MLTECWPEVNDGGQDNDARPEDKVTATTVLHCVLAQILFSGHAHIFKERKDHRYSQEKPDSPGWPCAAEGQTRYERLSSAESASGIKPVLAMNLHHNMPGHPVVASSRQWDLVTAAGL